MSINGLKTKIASVNWYAFLYAGLWALLLTDYFSLMTHSFDGLPADYSGIIRVVIAVVALLRFTYKGEKVAAPFKVLLPLLAGIGLALYLGLGHLFLLDIALIVMCSIDVKPLNISFPIWCSSFACLVGTWFLSNKGYIREYTFYGFNTFGFTKNYFAVIIIALTFLSFVASLVFFIRSCKNIKISTILFLGVIGIISVGAIFVAILKLDRTKALSDGMYTIYSGDTMQGVEIHMHGIEDYDLSLETHEASKFNIRWEGQYYGIYADTDGVERALCVVDGTLKLGDYDVAKDAHCWSIQSMPNSPYFWIQSAETGLCICIEEDGNLGLRIQEVQGRIHESCLFRLGDENLSYYEDINSSENIDKTDIADSSLTFDINTNYTGQAVTGDISLAYNGIALIEGRDYEVEYVDNYYPGQATVYIKGIGDFAGEIVTNFTILIDNTMSQYSNSDNVQDYVFRAYRLGFNRLPTPEEFYELKEYICLTLQTPDTMLWNLLEMGAFEDSNSELVEGIYRLMLQRNGTRSEYDLWVNALDTGSTRWDVINQISNSPDYQNIWPDFNLNFQ